ncbi:PulJ/GspJ family protein, partial [Klebsiella pneumoniae]
MAEPSACMPGLQIVRKRRRSMSKVPNGFTLLEVMLAIVIFSTLSFLASQVFSQ